MKTGEVIQLGGGNIGKALVGDVMSRAGLRVTFADVDQNLINNFNTEHGYPLQVVSAEGSHEHYIDGVSAISSLDQAAMTDHIVRADIITTAVGPSILPRVAPAIAVGLMERMKRRPKDEMHVFVVACENVERNTETLRDHILVALPDDDWRQRILDNVSFPNCAVDRIVPNTKSTSAHPLAVITEDYFQLAIDGKALKTDMPEIPGIEIVDDLEAVLAQKLFTLNGAHAAAAYWGYLKGCETIDEAIRDPNILALVNGLMDEVGAVIVRNYPTITSESQQAFAEKTVRRFMNPYLKDEPSRVGRDPQRKLGLRDRLIGPAVLALAAGETPANINMAIVGGFRFDSPNDKQAVDVHREIDKYGVDAAIVSVTGLAATHPIVRQVVAGYRTAELMN